LIGPESIGEAYIWIRVNQNVIIAVAEDHASVVIFEPIFFQPAIIQLLTPPVLRRKRNSAHTKCSLSQIDAESWGLLAALQRIDSGERTLKLSSPFTETRSSHIFEDRQPFTVKHRLEFPARTRMASRIQIMFLVSISRILQHYRESAAPQLRHDLCSRERLQLGPGSLPCVHHTSFKKARPWLHLF
jgi:hypothetical protein